MAVKSKINVPISGTMTTLHPETETDQVSDMTAFMKTLNQQGTDAAAVKTLLNISSGGESVPVGTIVAYSGNGTLPSKYIGCDGSAISRATYSKLYAVVGTIYGGGNGSTTFNLPNLSDNRFVEGYSTAGTKHSAGVPDISGTAGRTRFAQDAAGTGAFYMTEKVAIGMTTSGSVSAPGLGFKASGSNSIYGGSSTVQPKALTVRFMIKYE